jgi:hypothetical protein
VRWKTCDVTGNLEKKRSFGGGGIWSVVAVASDVLWGSGIRNFWRGAM